MRDLLHIQEEVRLVVRQASLFPPPSGYPSLRARGLRGMADALAARQSEILLVASKETSLTQDELTPEHARMVGTLRMFADLLDEGSWVRGSIDTPVAHPIGPNHDLRRMLMHLGHVAVFGSSNFPLAYGVCGGDTASALAAGGSVVVKEHPAHPRTGRLLLEIARDGMSHSQSNMRPGCLGYISSEDPADFRPAELLVQDPRISAVGFTGSVPGGLAIENLAQRRTTPIPVFAEMGSVNVVIVLTSALASDPRAVAGELADSILTRHGQQCTRPGLICIEPSPAADAFLNELIARLDAAPARRMLARNVADRYTQCCRDTLAGAHFTLRTARPDPVDRPDDPSTTVPMLFEFTPSNSNLYHEVFEGSADYPLFDEIFGPAAVIIRTPRIFESAPFLFRNRLVTSLYGQPTREEGAYLHSLTRSTGRLCFNSPTTGVRVATSMVHGGPFPATNAPHTTAVGPLAIERWCRPICFQNCPDAMLPPELQNANPLNIWRTINGALSKEPLA